MWSDVGGYRRKEVLQSNVEPRGRFDGVGRREDTGDKRGGETRRAKPGRQTGREAGAGQRGELPQALSLSHRPSPTSGQPNSGPPREIQSRRVVLAHTCTDPTAAIGSEDLRQGLKLRPLLHAALHRLVLGTTTDSTMDSALQQAIQGGKRLKSAYIIGKELPNSV